jgi:hypothetical protein
VASDVKTSIGDLLVRYSKNPYTRALVQLVPFGIGGAADSLVGVKVEKIREDRARTFFDELASGDLALTNDVIRSDEFLHCFFATTEAALKTRRHEKIVLFAKLLRASIGNDHPRHADEFEELLSILDELSYSEWQAMLILEECSRHPHQACENDLQWTMRHWMIFRSRVERELGIPESEFISFVHRMSRTGLYQLLVGYYDQTPGVGMLTPRFHRLHNFIGKL